MSNTILQAIIGSGVAALLYIFDCIRRSGLRLHDKIDALGAEMRTGFKDAAEARDKIRAEMRDGFKDAAEARDKIRAEMLAGFKDAAEARDKIRAEMLAGFTNQNATFNRVFDRINAVRDDVPSDISIRFEGVQHDFRVVRQDISSTNGSVADTNGRVDKLSQALLTKGIIPHPV